MPDSSSGAARRPRSHLHGAWLWRAAACGLAALFIVRLLYYVLHDVSDGSAVHFPARLFEEVTGAVLSVVPIAGLVWLVRHVPLERPARGRTVATYAAGFGVLTLMHTTAMIVVRASLAAAFGIAGYPYTFDLARYGYEAANDVIPFVAIVALLALADSVMERRERERRAAELEQSLLRAELSNLRLQLQPHFLFNALNTISATMYEDVEAADAQLGQLADLLRTSLRTTHSHEVAVRDELQLLRHYLELMRARFGERLQLAIDVPDEVTDLLVPPMVLQPLVENAVRHGGISRLGHGAVTVTLRRTAASVQPPELTLRVHEDGPPGETRSPDDSKDGGTGLSATARRLQLLYGDEQSMRAGAASEGGFEVIVRIPARGCAQSAGPTCGSVDVASAVVRG